MRAWLATPAEQFAWFQDRMVTLPLRLPLPDGFDPPTADPKVLRRLGFPARPDPETQRELYDFWVELFALPLEFEVGQLKDDLDFALPDQFQSTGRATTPAKHEASRNWSGASITPRDGRMFTHVVGSFKVPLVSAPAGVTTATEFRCSTWIGLDGQRGYINSTLPQIGTAQHLTLGAHAVRTCSAWVQWWPLTAFTFKHFQVDPRQRIMCWLNVDDPTHVVAVLRNMDTGQIRMFKMQAPEVVDPPQFPTAIQATVSGATAEWITERPAHKHSPELYELPDYGEVEFSDCYANSVDPDRRLPPRVDKLVGPKLIRMYRVAEDPHRSATISVAERLGYERIKTRYV